ncbi:hypothetical protein SNE40_019164 [Patella caerulea]|uniref:protein acetyllysine N-acetyltransferase n=1 Tax=Patella caerulea TaxID=87958 RepID=A0AAN8J840_PATCE
MANANEFISEIPAKRPRLVDENDVSKRHTSDYIGTNLLIGNGEEAKNDVEKTSKGSKNMEIIHFPENSGGLGSSSLDGAAQCSSPQSNGETTIDKPKEEKKVEGDEEKEDDSNDSWSTVSEVSGLSEDAWKPISGPISWVQRQMTLGIEPRTILNEMLPSGMAIPPDLDNYAMWRIIINLLMEPPKRKKLEHINTIEDVVHLMKTCKKIVVLTGAGVSVSCGIPDFRSRDGVYARLAVDFPNLPNPQAMFDINFFQSDPRPFFKFAKEIYPGQFEPSKCHKFIKLIENHDKLLQNYTQNIDTLEQVAGIKNVIQCHGSFATAQCMACKYKVDAEVIKEDIFNQVIPKCPVCPFETPYAIMKPNIVFFGESLPEEFHRQMAEDKDECDLLIVIGSSLKVRPVALIPNSLPAHVPQILINRERLRHIGFDVELLGDCDVIVNELCHRLGEGWDTLCNDESLQQIHKSELSGSIKGACSNSIVSSYTDSCELRSDTCLAMYDSNSSDCTSLVQSTVTTSNNTQQNNNNCDTDTVDSTSIACSPTRLSDSVVVNDELSSDSKIDTTTDDNKPTSAHVETNKNDELDASIEKMRAFYQRSPRCSLAKRLRKNQFLHMEPNRYVFSGAEVYSDDGDSDNSDGEDDDISDAEAMTSKDEGNQDTSSSEQLSNIDSANNIKENYEMSVKEIDIASNSLH